MASGSHNSQEYPRSGPDRVRRSVMRQRWERLTMLHWRYPAEAVQSLLPEGLTVDTFDGDAWVGLVPFFMRTSLPGTPYVPWLSNFPETNVRTYVRGAKGNAVWFCSLDVTRLAAVVAARVSYSLPYCWSHMEIDGPTAPADSDTIFYRSDRRWPQPRRAHTEVAIQIGRQRTDEEFTDLDNFLTGRWALYSASYSGRLRHAKVWHEPWVFHEAQCTIWSDELVVAAGLNSPVGPPVVHYSPGVDVRIAIPTSG
ncbi:MAG: YqjF family protein [Acidimicrobiales bacterium]